MLYEVITYSVAVDICQVISFGHAFAHQHFVIVAVFVGGVVTDGVAG